MSTGFAEEVPAFIAGRPEPGTTNNFELVVRPGPSVLKEPAAPHETSSHIIILIARNDGRSEAAWAGRIWLVRQALLMLASFRSVLSAQ